MKVFSSQNSEEAQALSHHLGKLGYKTQVSSVSGAFGKLVYEVQFLGNPVQESKIRSEILKFRGQFSDGKEVRFAGGNPMSKLRVIVVVLIIALICFLLERQGISVRSVLSNLMRSVTNSM